MPIVFSNGGFTPIDICFDGENSDHRISAPSQLPPRSWNRLRPASCPVKMVAAAAVPNFESDFGFVSMMGFAMKLMRFAMRVLYGGFKQ